MRLRPKTTRDLWLTLIALLLTALYVSGNGGGFPLDDSWIHQVYGRNLGLHGQWAFVLNEPSAASTAPLYTVLLSVGYLLRFPSYELWAHLLGGLALAAGGIFAAHSAERLLPDHRRAGWAAGLSIIFTWHLIWSAASGMETMLFCLWTLILIWLTWRELDADRPQTPGALIRRGALFGFTTTLATTTRPEGVVLAAVAGGLMLLARPQGSWANVWRWGIAAGATFLITLTPYLLLNLTLAGDLVPNTSAAKQAQLAPLLQLPLTERLSRLSIAILAGGQILFIPSAAYLLGVNLLEIRRDRRRLLFLLPIGWIFGLILLYALRLPADFQHGRYVIPALPALMLMGSAGMLRLLTAARHRMLTRIPARSLALAAALALMYYALIVGRGVYHRDIRIINQEHVAQANWIAENLPPDELLALYDIGAVGYFASRELLDIAGLITPEAIPLAGKPAELWAFMESNGARYLMAFTDQVPGRDLTDPRLCPLHQTAGREALLAGGSKMVIYRLAWDGQC